MHGDSNVCISLEVQNRFLRHTALGSSLGLSMAFSIPALHTSTLVREKRPDPILVVTVVFETEHNTIGDTAFSTVSGVV